MITKIVKIASQLSFIKNYCIFLKSSPYFCTKMRYNFFLAGVDLVCLYRTTKYELKKNRKHIHTVGICVHIFVRDVHVSPMTNDLAMRNILRLSNKYESLTRKKINKKSVTTLK
jgi:hypothetical protein